MNTGANLLGRPSMGSWITYGLGTENENLPGYVVLASGRGASGGATNWTSGFLPSTYEGVVFRGQGEPVLNLKNPAGLPPHLRRAGLDTLRELNEAHYQRLEDPETLSRITSYELAFRMQTAAPEPKPEANGMVDSTVRRAAGASISARRFQMLSFPD